jgi:hypothetical protein
VSRLDVLSTLSGIVGRAERIGFAERLRFHDLIRSCCVARQTLRLGEVPFEILHTPAAAGPCPAAFADLARTTRLMDANEVDDLPLGDVKAIANGVVEIHELFVPASVSVVALTRRGITYELVDAGR